MRRKYCYSRTGQYGTGSHGSDMSRKIRPVGGKSIFSDYPSRTVLRYSQRKKRLRMLEVKFFFAKKVRKWDADVTK